MRLGAVVLAAGASVRLGQPKQLVGFEGEALLRRAARLACAVADPVVVVLPPDPAPFLPCLEGLPARVVANVHANEGMSASLRLGIASLPMDVQGALLLVVDQWAVTGELLEALKAAFAKAPSRAVASAYAGSLGVPAILPRGEFEALRALRGDRGAKALLAKAVPIAFPEGTLDLDLPTDLQRLKR